MRSETCSPRGSMILSSWPRLTMKPVAGLRREVPCVRGRSSSPVTAAFRWNGQRHSARRGIASGVLARFRRSPKSARFGFDVPCSAMSRSRIVAAKPLESSVGAQPLELRVRIEHQRRPAEAPRQARAPRMQADDEQRAAGEAEREVRIVRDRRSPTDPSRPPGRRVVQPLQLLPQPPLELALARRRAAGEHGDERGQPVYVGTRPRRNAARSTASASDAASEPSTP